MHVLQVERSHDDNVKLKILQTALTLLQNPSYADDEVGECRPFVSARTQSVCGR